MSIVSLVCLLLALPPHILHAHRRIYVDSKGDLKLSHLFRHSSDGAVAVISNSTNDFFRGPQKSQGCWCKYATSSSRKKICIPNLQKCCVLVDPGKKDYERQAVWLEQHVCGHNYMILPLGLPEKDDNLAIDAVTLWQRAYTVLEQYQITMRSSPTYPGWLGAGPGETSNFGGLSHHMINKAEFLELFRPQILKGWLTEDRLSKIFRAVTYGAEVVRRIEVLNTGISICLNRDKQTEVGILLEEGKTGNVYSFDNAIKIVWRNTASVEHFMDARLFKFAYIAMVLFMHKSPEVTQTMLAAAGYGLESQEADWAQVEQPGGDPTIVTVNVFRQLVSPEKIQTLINSGSIPGYEDKFAELNSEFGVLVKDQPRIKNGVKDLVLDKFTFISGRPETFDVLGLLVSSVSSAPAGMSKEEFGLAAFIVRGVYDTF